MSAPPRDDLHLPLNDLSADFIASAGRGDSRNINLVQSSQTSPRPLYERSPTRSPSTALVEYPSSSMNSTAAAGGYATADLQRSLIQQQLQLSQREASKMKEELQMLNGKLREVVTQLNEQRMEHSSLTHRYSTVVEKLTSSESIVKRLEDQLVQERARHKTTREEKETLKIDLRDLRWECDRLQKTVEELEASRGLSPQEVQRLLEDRQQYIPAVEVRRMEGEMQASQESLVHRLETALGSLLSASEEGETNYFVARSAVQSAKTDLESRVSRAETTLESLHTQLAQFRDGVEAETIDFMAALLAENKELWQHLSKLQQEYDMVFAELELKQQRGEVVPLQQHQYVQRQLETVSDRLSKAQQVIETQMILSREHEREMQSLMEQNDALTAELEELREQWKREKASGEDKSGALVEAETALKEAAEQIEQLQDTIRVEREKADATLKENNKTNDAIQQEYEDRLRKLQSNLTTATERAVRVEKELEETLGEVEGLRRELREQAEYYDTYRAKVEETLAEQERNQTSEVSHVRAMLEEELEHLRQQLDRAGEEGRAASRARDEALTKITVLESTVHKLQEDLRDAREETAKQREQGNQTLEELRAVRTELETLRLESGAGGSHSQELQKQLERITKERDERSQRLVETEERERARYQQLQQEWRSCEEARTALQEELKSLRLRCAAAEGAVQAQEHQQQDREYLMKANLKLHEQYQEVQQENRSLVEQLHQLRQKSGIGEQLQQQLEEFQSRLRELPLLRQAADDARRDLLKAREETEALRRERDDMAARLDAFLEESKSAAAKDDDFDRLFKDASEAAKRLSGQVSTARGRPTKGSYSGDYHVFTNTRPSPKIPTGNTPSRVSSASRDRSTAAVGGSESPRKTPQRPWKH